MKAIFSVLLLSVFLATAASQAQAERLAIIIGNSSYENFATLQNPHADAEGYAKAFRGLNYRVFVFFDLDLEAMWKAFDEFASEIQPGDEVAIVFSGHGWSNNVENFLVPVDAPSDGTENRLRRTSLPLRNGRSGILDLIEQRAPRTTIAIIDACRDYPYQIEELARTRSGGTLTRGLVRETIPSGTFVIFSAGYKQKALDGLPNDPPTGMMSVFTRTFVPKGRVRCAAVRAFGFMRSPLAVIERSAYHDAFPT